tara:strand:- start:3223 stop:5685 length:2463 start_codon:yes stop_codon:yes gene_type:complete
MSIDTAGGFGELRTNNNWMAPIRDVRGAFWAVSCLAQGRRDARILRQSHTGGREYKNITPVQYTSFRGKVPCFAMRFADTLPVSVLVSGFSPMIPHNTKDSTLPAALFTVTLFNESQQLIDTSFLFSWENVVGYGGTGQTGVSLFHQLPVALRGWLEHSSSAPHLHRGVSLPGLVGISMSRDEQAPEGAHRRSVLGEHVLLAEATPGVSLSVCESWDADAKRPWLLESFVQTGDIPGEDNSSMCRPASAISARTFLRPGEHRVLRFYVIWWMPDHVLETTPYPNAIRGQHDGERVGHFYEHSFRDPASLSAYLYREKDRLYQQTREPHLLIEESTYPHWLKNALINSADAAITNTLVPKDGTMYTIEGVDWPWYFGGLTGTNDQRLSSHPFTSTFFTALDRAELDAFRALVRDGACPHGNGNCDLALGDAEIPYGWPVQILGALEDLEWPDLTMSLLLQIMRYYKQTGDKAYLEACWDEMLEMFARLRREGRDNIPVGGSTYDTFSFPGLFMYTATLYLVVLEGFVDLARERDPAIAHLAAELKRFVLHQVETKLWDERGFYRATEKKETLFFGSLAGVWFARYLGYPSPLPLQKVHAHLGWQHQLLVAPQDSLGGKAAFEISEVSIDGQPHITKMMGVFPIHAYAWQVVSYHGFASIYAGRIEEGMTAIRMLYERIWQRGWPWSADLYGNAGCIYMSHPVLWGITQALTGAALDLPKQILRFSKHTLSALHPMSSKMALPIFFPSFWGMLVREPNSHYISLHIHKHFEEPIEIREIILDDLHQAPQYISCSPSWRLEAGQTFTFYCASDWEIRPALSPT